MARHERVGEVVIVRPIPDSDVGRRFAAGSFRIVPGEGTVFEQVGGDELLFEDRRSRDQPFVAVVTAPAPVAELRIVADLLPPAAAPPVPGARALARRVAAIVPPAASALAPAARELAAIVPWLVQDALVHYLAPRGLEQYSGGGWGTRDVCQGPVEMLLALGEPAPVRDVLWRVFAAQNAAGDWPQWFMFFERERDIRPAEAHGDVVFWPLLALGRYLEATGDAAILDEPVPFFDGAPASVWEHVERALAVVAASALPGTRLTALGHGDWNDSLQPVDPAMRQRLCSAWTATLHREAFLTLAAGIQHHRAADAERLREIAAAVADDFRRLLVVDGVVAGFADLGGDAGAEYLLHPRDRATGVHYRLLPMIHAIAGGLLTPEQARRHVDLIADHLLGRDGARLFDRPPRYQGGSQRIFQRAESSTFFGREIGLMYMHAHLRYAQAMAYYGDADAFFLALRQANPIGVASVVAGARPRQANCYTSSSDAVFADRYAAAADYGRVRRGGVDFEGGWRVYSSGAGIMVRLVHECLLGVRRSTAVLTLDPVIPAALDGLRAEVAVGDAAMSIEYRVARHGRGPRRLELNGEPLAFEREPNPYRPGAAVVPLAGLRARLRGDGNELIVDLD